MITDVLAGSGRSVRYCKANRVGARRPQHPQERRNTVDDTVIPPLIMFLKSRTFYAACSSFCIGVIPPFAILGRSLLYRHNHCVAVS